MEFILMDVEVFFSFTVMYDYFAKLQLSHLDILDSPHFDFQHVVHE